MESKEWEASLYRAQKIKRAYKDVTKQQLTRAIVEGMEPLGDGDRVLVRLAIQPRP